MTERSFILYPGYSLPPFRHPYSCSDTIETRCYENISLQDCISKCKNSPLCSAGYYLSSGYRDSTKWDTSSGGTSSGGTSYCFPLYSERLRENNPSFDMRPSSKFRISGDSVVFLDKEKYSGDPYQNSWGPYPPDNANAIFFQDILLIKKADSDLYLFTTSSQDDTIKFSENAKVNLRLLKRYGYDRNVSVNYGDEIALSLPGTNLILSQERGVNNINWNSLLSGIIAEEGIFIIEGETSAKQVAYGDKFRLKFLGSEQGYYLSLNDLNELIISETPTAFEFVPSFNVYYCDRGKCKSVPLQEASSEGLKARYQSKIVYRSNICYDQCKRSIFHLIIIGVILLISIIIIFLLHTR